MDFKTCQGPYQTALEEQIFTYLQGLLCEDGPEVYTRRGTCKEEGC